MTVEEKRFVEKQNLVQKFDTLLAEIAGWLVVIMMLIISYDVFMRYVFDSPTRWSLEISEYLLLAVVYFSGAWALPAGGHVRVDIIYNKLSKKTQALVEIFLGFLGFIFTAILTYESILFVIDGIVTKARSDTYLEVLQWPIRSLTVIGAGLLCLEFIFRIIKYFNIYKSS